MKLSFAWTLIMTVAAAGCGSAQSGAGGDAAPGDATSTTEVKADGRKPDEVVRLFFEGLKTGDEGKIQAMLTAKARANDLINPEPRNASFQVGDVRFVSEAIAHVPSVWTFFDEGGQKIGTDEAIWALRLEPEGWRIAGTMMQVPDLKRMVALDFENKEEYEAIKREVESEIAKVHSGGEAVDVARRETPQGGNPPKRGSDAARTANPRNERTGSGTRDQPLR
jgi:hypothetical protein